MAVKVKIEGFDPAKISKRLIDNEQVGTYMAETTAKHMKKYVPFQTGTLSSSYITEPWKVKYTAPYAHYMYEGKVYGPNRPIIKDGVLVGWYSPKKKFPTGKQIQYSSPLATHHWDRATQKKQGKMIAQEMTEFIKRL